MTLLSQNLNYKRILILGAWAILLFVEFLPKPIPSSKIAIPDYINLLKNLPDGGGLIDTITPPSIALYYQTVHEKPIAFGYLARIPTSVVAYNTKILQAFQNKRYNELLGEYDIKYVLSATQEEEGACGFLKPLYIGQEIGLYQIVNQTPSYEEADLNTLSPCR